MEQVNDQVAAKQNRSPRAQESRQVMARPTSWKPPETLPSPDPRPGITHRWVRTSMMGQTDAPNISSKFREGYEPCKAEDYPEMMMHAVQEGRFKGNIEHGGLLLCAIPTEFLKQREAYFANVNKSQMESVDNNFMRDNDPRMSKFAERSTKVSFGTGS
jgi:hypothetical protein